ncbi:hypothetical protein BJ912DRAFT_981187 [Pholiota molesta]|nr:hypothetical protein BJ912DRAFT_981187 [Pholiota molesta]
MSFLLDPTSPSTSASTSASSPDSLAFPPGIAETILTTVDDGSKSRILVPPTPSDAGPSPLAPSPSDPAAPPPPPPPHHTHGGTHGDADADADTAAAAATGAWHHRTQSAPSRAQSGVVTSPAGTSQTATATALRGPARFLLVVAPQSAAERSPPASTRSSDSSVQHSRSRFYSESESSGSSTESSSASGDDGASPSTERARWPAPDVRVRSARAAGKLRADIAAGVGSGSGSGRGLADEARRSALSPTPRVRMSESLLFSHSLPPQVKWKGKERERDPELDVRKERTREKAPQQHHRRRSSGATSLSKIRTTRGDTVIKYEEPGFSRDFFLLIALCIGIACGFVLVARPAMLSLLGHPGSVSFSLADLD